MATLYKTDGTSELLLPTNRRKFTLEELQEFVGGSIERIRVRAGVLIVNEEGQILGLPENLRAMMLTGGLHYIVGNAVLMGRGDKW